MTSLLDSLPIESIQRTCVQIAIETTGQSGSIAVLEGEKIHQATVLPPGNRTAATLAPALNEVLQWCNEHDKHPDFLSVAAGPGSFTGLRIGVTTAKTFCYAKQLPLVAVDSIAAIAVTAFHDHASVDHLLVGINAYRGQTFAGQFTRNQLIPALSTASIPDTSDVVSVMDQSQWLARLAATADQTHLAGEAKCFGDAADTTRFVTRQSPEAVGVGLLALRMAFANKFCDPLALVPRYLKPSAAEEKHAKAN
ncbi:MAG: tRNA (adenosine(37)-N6)-threonylcarbamoyltransferase complex dimerization subunit type 1 TsaB [Pirellulaceae bacterium]